MVVTPAGIARPESSWSTQHGAATLAQNINDLKGASSVMEDLDVICDILSLHVPLTSETQHLIDAAAIGRMRHGAVLINTARGELVDQVALTEALRDGHLAAAGLGVFAKEPPNLTDLLLSLPNVVVTPHIGWLTTGTFDRSFALAAENWRRLAAGETLLYRVA